MAGWPWPLDAVQGWFEGLWSHITEAVTSAADAIQAWVSESVGWLHTQLKAGWDWIVDQVGAFIAGVSDAIKHASTWIVDQVSAVRDALGKGLMDVAAWLRDQVTAFIDGVASTVQNVGSWLSSTIWGWVDGALRWATDTFAWLRNEVAETGGYVVDQVTAAFDGAVGGLVETFAGWPGALGSAFSGVFEGLLRSLGAVPVESSPAIMHFREMVPGPVAERVGWMEGVIGKGLEAGVKWILDALKWISETIVGAMGAIREAIAPVVEPPLRALIESATAAVTPGSPPAEVEKATKEFSEKFLEKVKSLIPEHKSPLPTLAELLAASAGVVGLNMLTVFGMDSVATYLDLAHPMKMTGIMNVAGDMLNSLNFPSMIGPILFSNIYAGIIIPLRYRWNEVYQHMIPPQPDLVKMVVREAFVPEMVIKAPEEFTAHMRYHGFAEEWSDRYWTAHFEPIALTQAYANLWRGYWDKKQFMYALHIADVHPMWREHIYNVAYRPLTRRELRYGWETGVVSPEKMIAAFRAMGLSLEDAEIAAESSMEYALHEERMGVLTEWRYDFQDGLIDEAAFRANMESIKILGVRQDYYVARATIRRERTHAKSLLDLYRDGFMKDLITEEELRDRSHEIIVIPEVADLFVEKAYVDKWKKPQPPKETEADKALKELNKYRVTYAIQAYRKYATEKAELISMLVAADVDPAIAATRADYEELKRPIPGPTEDEKAGAKEETRVQKLEERTAIEQYRAEVIDADGLYRRLIEIGYSDVLATAITQLEVVRAVE